MMLLREKFLKQASVLMRVNITLHDLDTYHKVRE